MIDTTKEIEAALKGEESKASIWWDDQDPSNAGPAYRIIDGDEEESGPLEFQCWSNGEEDIHGYELDDFFTGIDGVYIGPDSDGIYPHLTW